MKDAIKQTFPAFQFAFTFLNSFRFYEMKLSAIEARFNFGCSNHDLWPCHSTLASSRWYSTHTLYIFFFRKARLFLIHFLFLIASLEGLRSGTNFKMRHIFISIKHSHQTVNPAWNHPAVQPFLCGIAMPWQWRLQGGGSKVFDLTFQLLAF